MGSDVPDERISRFSRRVYVDALHGFLRMRLPRLSLTASSLAPFFVAEPRPIQPSPLSMAASNAPPVGPSMNYHLLASLMSVQPDFAIFRRFLASNARDLLRLQDEITYLESDLESIIAADRASGDPNKAEFEFCIASLKDPPHPSREKGLQWEKQVELS